MSGLSSDVSGAEPYAPPGSATVGTAQAVDVSACLITLPLTLLVTPADVEIYGKAMTSAAPLVDCSGMLDLDVLVGATPADSAINFKQDDADANLVTVTVPAGFDDTAAGKFAVGFDGVLNKPVQLKSLDMNAYVWWNEDGKSIATDPNFGNPKSVLYQHADFSQFVLAKIAYDVFGHPLAQAGIANDKTITDELKGTSGTAGSLGTRLAAAFKQLSAAQLQSIYEQMLAQDPSRFNLEDASGGAIGSNGASQVGMPRTLPFSNKDTIRFEIVIDDYDVKRVALNTAGGNNVTTASGATIESGIAAASANSGGVLSTRYAGLRTTVQVKLTS